MVEDDQAVRELVRTLLEELLDVPTVPAGDGEEALRQIRRSRPVLVVLDIMLPRLSGLEVARRLKSDPATRDVPLIALTTASREEVVGAGCDDLIAKPFDLSLFEAKVRRHLAAMRRPGPSRDAPVKRAA